MAAIQLIYLISGTLMPNEQYDEAQKRKKFIIIKINNNYFRYILANYSRNYSDEKITSILKNQLSDEIFRKKCKKVLENNGDIAEILQQIKFLLEIQ